MTPEQELNTMWPFPPARPKEGPKTETKSSTPAFITGARGTEGTVTVSAGSNGGTSIGAASIDWSKAAVTTSVVLGKDSTIAVLDERAKNYGPFKDMAAITQSFKKILHTAPSWKNMQADQQESLEMIVHKIARILNGQPDYADSWVDIAGYAKLVSERLEKGIIR